MGDILDTLLELPLPEGGLGPDTRGAFAQALRDRGERVLRERVRPLEERLKDLTTRLAAVETELTWRLQTIVKLEAAREALENESAWKSETIAAQSVTVESLKTEMAWRIEAMKGLDAANHALQEEANRLVLEMRRAAAAHAEEVTRLTVESQKGAAAHDRLLAHHRGFVAQAIDRLDEASRLPIWRFRELRTRLEEWAALFRREIS